MGMSNANNNKINDNKLRALCAARNVRVCAMVGIASDEQSRIDVFGVGCEWSMHSGQVSAHVHANGSTQKGSEFYCLVVINGQTSEVIIVFKWRSMARHTEPSDDDNRGCSAAP